jgi:hypothetical protein
MYLTLLLVTKEGKHSTPKWLNFSSQQHLSFFGNVKTLGFTPL